VQNSYKICWKLDLRKKGFARAVGIVYQLVIITAIDDDNIATKGNIKMTSMDYKSHLLGGSFCKTACIE
jgi:hypothetical protein